MKISIEIKNGKYIITYGKLTGTGSSAREAKDKLVQSFNAELGKFFPD